MSGRRQHPENRFFGIEVASQDVCRKTDVYGVRRGERPPDLLLPKLRTPEILFVCGHSTILTEEQNLPSTESGEEGGVVRGTLFGVRRTDSSAPFADRTVRQRDQSRTSAESSPGSPSSDKTLAGRLRQDTLFFYGQPSIRQKNRNRTSTESEGTLVVCGKDTQTVRRQDTLFFYADTSVCQRDQRIRRTDIRPDLRLSDKTLLLSADRTLHSSTDKLQSARRTRESPSTESGEENTLVRPVRPNLRRQDTLPVYGHPIVC